MNQKILKILLADNDADDREFFAKALYDLPITTKLFTVNDGLELMELPDNEKFVLYDKLFLDINMPKKNGLECLFEIRQHEKLNDLCVVMFSTSNSRQNIHMIFKTSVNVYNHKPCDFKQPKQVIFNTIPTSTENNFSKNQVKYALNA